MSAPTTETPVVWPVENDAGGWSLLTTDDGRPLGSYATFADACRAAERSGYELATEAEEGR